MQLNSSARDARAGRRTLLGALCVLFISTAAQAQSLPNGGHVSGAITTAGGQDTYTFPAVAGESLRLRVAETGGDGLFQPGIRLYRPDGSLVTGASGHRVAPISPTADATGTYTVAVVDTSPTQNATGPYNLYFVRVPGANEHGLLPNGGQVSGIIDVGDLDSYTLTANAGENIRLRVAKTDSTATLRPQLSLFRPDGSLVSGATDSTVASYSHTALTSGTYTVVVTDVSNGFAGTGSYTIHYAKAPGADELGRLYDGQPRDEEIELGDLDSYTFTANAGDTAHLQVTDTSGGALQPQIALYRPDGSLRASTSDGSTVTLNIPITVTGVYTVVVADVSTGLSATGSYRILLTGTGGDADVPLPPWSLGLLAAVLGGSAARRWRVRP